MTKKSSAPYAGAQGLACAAILALAASSAAAHHVGEEVLLDQQAVASTDQLLTALRQYERTPATQRAALADQLALVAAQRRDRMLALIELNPRIAALRVLPQSVRARLPAKAQAFVEQPVMIEGSVAATIGDDFEHGRSQRHLQMADAAGQRFELRVAHATDREQLGWVGKRGAVTAMRLDRYLLVLDKRHVQLAAAGGKTTTQTTTTSAATSSAIQGDQSTLVIMTNFTDKAIACTPADLQSRLFDSSGATLNQGFRESSGNLVSFSGQVVGPFTINYSSTGTCDFNGWATAANAAAQAAGFNPSAYKHVSYVTAYNATCGWTGLATIGGTPPTPSWVQACNVTGAFSHELGHNLGLNHAATPTLEYGDSSDPMGGAKLVQFNAANRVMAGWLGSSAVRDVAIGGTYAISAAESTAPTSPQVLRLFKADTAEYYYVSLRQSAGVDTGLMATYLNTLSIHRATGVLPAKTYLLANLVAGQTWADSANGIQVTHQALSGSTATVGIGFGGATCARQPPTINVSPAAQSGAPGAMLTYSLTVTNTNSAACPSSAFNLAQTLPPGLSGSLGSTSMTLGSGASGTVGWNVGSSISSADAVYTLAASASESSTTNSADVHASYTVLTPPPPPPPPPPIDTTPPTLSITSPAANAVLSGRTATLSATASDSAGVASVEFYLDGKLLASNASAPYGATWNLRKTTAGPHSIRVRAIDVNNNVAEQSISVTLGK